MSVGSDSLEVSSGSNYAGMMRAASESNPDSSMVSDSSGFTDYQIASAAALAQNVVSGHLKRATTANQEGTIQFGNFDGPSDARSRGSDPACRWPNRKKQ